MGKILNFFRRKKRDNKSSKHLLNEVERYLDSLTHTPPPLSNEEYAEMRRKQVEWLESHYNFNTAKGIQSIPVSKYLERPPFGGVTGDVDYYLRFKAKEHEAVGNLDLAILCLKKSNEIRALRKIGYRKSDYLELVRLLVRVGRVEEAQKEKAKIDAFFGNASKDVEIGHTSSKIQRVLKQAELFNTDLVIMSVHGCSCPECAKHQGRVFSLSGKSKIFPKIPDAFYAYGAIHEGCRHTFYAYIHGVTNPNLEYTLSIQGLKKSKKIKDIVAFSNRPFIDDRPPELIKQAEEYRAKNAAAEARQREYENNIIEIELERVKNQQLYKTLKSALPEVCPKSFNGFMRMKKQNTKNYQKLKMLAKEKGIEI